MKNLSAILDARSTPIWARLISDSTSGKYAQALTLETVAIPAVAQVAIFGAGQPYMVSGATFTPPAAVGDSIPNEVLVNPGSIWLEGLTNLYYSAFSEGLVNIEFYKISGSVRQQ